jgi:LPXTG-motif cell wall-anchored protein
MDRDVIRRALSLGFANLMGLGCIIAVGLAQQTTTLERGEVLAVNGNDIMVKMDTGEVRHYTAPPGATANVDGKQITVADLRPGMKLQRTTISTTTERVVSSVRTTEGTVWQVNAPYVIFTGPDGKNKQVKVPDGTKFNIGGESKTVFDLRKGMKFTATIVTQSPETVVTSTRTTTGSAPPPPKPVVARVPAKLDGPMLIEEAPAPKPVQVAKSTPAQAAAPSAPAAAVSAPEPLPKKLPKTGTPLPMMGLLGLALSLAGFGIRLARKS